MGAKWQAPCTTGWQMAGRERRPNGYPKTHGHEENTMNRKTPTLIGAAVGLATFLAVALLPALLYGGYAGVLLG